MIVDRNRYGELAKIIVQTVTTGGDPDEIASLVTEQMVRTIQADPAFGQAGAIVRLCNAVEGMAVSLHTIQGMMAMDLSARGVLDLETIQGLMQQGMDAYARNEKHADENRPKDEADLPPGVLG